jgi:hypothetical protein
MESSNLVAIGLALVAAGLLAVGRRHFGRPCLGGQLLPGPASGPA